MSKIEDGEFYWVTNESLNRAVRSGSTIKMDRTAYTDISGPILDPLSSETSGDVDKSRQNQTPNPDEQAKLALDIMRNGLNGRAVEVKLFCHVMDRIIEYLSVRTVHPETPQKSTQES